RPCADAFAVGLGFRRLACEDIESPRLLLGVDHGLEPGLLALLGREPKRRHQRYVNATERRVRAGHRPCPQPRDNSRLASDKLRRQINFKYEVYDTLAGLLTPPCHLDANIGG